MKLSFFAADAIRIVDVAIGAGEIGDLAAELVDLLHDAPANIAVAGHSDAQALDALAVVLEDFAQIIDSAEAGRLGTEDGAAGADLAGPMAPNSAAPTMRR